MGGTPQKKTERTSGADKRREVFHRKQLVCDTISRAVIGIPGIFVFYCFPQTPLWPKKNSKIKTPHNADLMARPRFPRRSIALLDVFHISFFSWDFHRPKSLKTELQEFSNKGKEMAEIHDLTMSS
jgi:hypothetical protein